jgi:hypothetical protein
MTAAVSYTVMGYDAKNLRVQLSFDGGKQFLFAQMSDPLPKTIAAFDEFVKSFAPSYSTLASRQLDHSVTDEIVERLIGTTRSIEIAPVPMEPALPADPELETAQEDYIREIVTTVLMQKGLI